MSTDDVDLAADLHHLTAALEGVGRDMAEVRAGLTEESETRRLENAELRSQNALLIRQNSKLERNSQVSRRLIYLVTALVVTIAVAVTLGAVAYSQFRAYQGCRNDRTGAFLDFERAKVAGQIVGVDGQLAGIDRVLAGDPAGGLEAYRAGALQFKSASQGYLDAIAHAKDC